MKQSRIMSMVEAAANVVVGYVLAIATQIIVFPWFGIETGLAEHLTIGLAFVGVSLIISPRLGEVEPDALFALASGFLAAMAYMFVRDLRSTDSPTGVVF